MRKLLKVDQALREDTHLLPKRVRKLIEQLKGARGRDMAVLGYATETKCIVAPRAL